MVLQATTLTTAAAAADQAAQVHLQEAIGLLLPLLQHLVVLAV
jgi:hypothetical protein